VAIGFLVPPILVPNSESLGQIGDDLSIMFYGGAGYMTLLLILVIISKLNTWPKLTSTVFHLAIHQPTHSLAHPPTCALTHSLTHSLYIVIFLSFICLLIGFIHLPMCTLICSLAYLQNVKTVKTPHTLTKNTVP
jgi:hypothetical protein